MIDTKSLSVARTLSVERPQGVGTSPTYVIVTPDGCDLLSADSGEDAVAVFALSKKKAAGRRASPRARRRGRRNASPRPGRRQAQREGREEVERPQGQEVPARRPDPDRALPDGGGRDAQAPPARLGLRSGPRRRPNPGGPNPNTGDDTYLNQYLPSIVYGASGRAQLSERPEDPQADPDQRPPGDPRRRPHRAGGHTDPRPAARSSTSSTSSARTAPTTRCSATTPSGDGDPALTLFGTRSRPTSMRSCSASRCWITSTRTPRLRSTVTTGRRPAPSPTTWSRTGTRTTLAATGPTTSAPTRSVLRQGLHLPAHAESQDVSFYNYGEALAGLSPFADKDRTPGADRQNAQVLTRAVTDVAAQRRLLRQRHLDLRHARDRPEGRERLRLEPAAGIAARRRLQVQLLQARKFQAQLAANSVPTFNYLSLPARPHRGPFPREAHSGCRHRRQRLGPRPDRRRDLAFIDLEQLADPGGRGRFPGRRRPRRRAPHPGARDQPVHAAGRGVHDRYDQLSFFARSRSSPACRPSTW